MKKIIYSVLMMAMAAFTFTSCEDVPMPYDNPNNPSGRDGGEIGESSLPFSSSSCNDFTAITVKGAPWSLGSSYAKATGYADGTTTETEAWLVSPAITLKTDVGAVITLDHVIRYTQSNNDLQKHQLLISDNFTGDVTSATWTQLAYEPKASSTNTWDFYSSNAIQIPSDFLNKTVNIAFKFTCDNKNSTTWEVQNFKVEEGTGGSSGGGGEEPSGETIGSLDNPKTCAEALALINALADGAESDGNAYVKGKVVKVTTNQTNFEKYGNLNYWISDDGSETNQIQVYSGDGLNGEKFKSITDIGPGDEVVVFGKLYKYVKDGKMTPEINKGNYLVKYTKGSGGGGGETPSTDAKKVTVAEFNAAEVNENVWYQLTGTVENLKDGDQYGNFDLKDETGSVYVYGLLSEKGGEKKKFQDLAAAKGIKNGSKITIIGTRGVHNDKIEVMNAYFVSIEGGGGSGEQGGSGSGNGPGTVSGNTITVSAADFGVENSVAMGTQTLSDGTKLVFDGGGNNNPPKYYSSGTTIRMYPKNSVTITASKNIQKVVLNCDEYQGTIYTASGDVAASPGTVAVDGKVVTISGISSKSTKISNTSEGTGGASQIRIVTIEITYAN